MATSKRHTFQEILKNGISIPSNNNIIKIDKIIIPRIQRSYAQGRKTEAEVRKSFLDEIFDNLRGEEDGILELSFLFGSKQKAASGGEGFELLDGQQRITTLFLLHWYLWIKEKNGKDTPDYHYLSKFTYETRDTSTQFINNIVKKPIPFKEGVMPSKILKSQKWFTEIFNCDATVCSMLTMLDSIDEKYKTLECNNLYEKLNRIQFYVLYLDEFELNDELYIKMNSRGLDLTPFENFKASLIRFMRKEKGKFIEDVGYNGAKMPYYLRFSTKMDTIWNDIFWKLPKLPNGDVCSVIDINNKEKDKQFFRFIIRYLFTQLVLHYDKEIDYKTLEDFFYKNIQKENELITAESQYALEERLSGWEYFQKMFLLLGYDGICKLETVLDLFSIYYYVSESTSSSIRDIINSNPFGNNNNMWDVFCDYKSYTLPNRVVFAAITEFLTLIPNNQYNDPIIQKNLKQMLRVLWNIIENTKIEDIRPAISTIKAMSEIINLPGAVTDGFYTAIATQPISSQNIQLKEEIVKAKKISANYDSDPGWENAFINAEQHPFFRGMIRFFYEDSINTSDEFISRYDVVSKLFDAHGIVPQYRNEHILIRALISMMNSWEGNDGLKGKSLTENNENEGYLKIILGTHGAKNLFCDFFKQTDTDNVESYLKKIYANAQWSDISDHRKKRVFNRLVSDSNASKLLEKMFEIENEYVAERRKNQQFQIVESCNVIVARVPKNEQIVLDTERHLILKELEIKGFKFVDSNQKSAIESFGDVLGYDVSMSKNISDSAGNQITLVVEFDRWRQVNFYIKQQDADLTSISDKLEQKADKWLWKDMTVSYETSNDFSLIYKKIEEIEFVARTL